MKNKYSIFSMVKNAFSYNENWQIKPYENFSMVNPNVEQIPNRAEFHVFAYGILPSLQNPKFLVCDDAEVV